MNQLDKAKLDLYLTYRRMIGKVELTAYDSKIYFYLHSEKVVVDYNEGKIEDKNIINNKETTKSK